MIKGIIALMANLKYLFRTGIGNKLNNMPQGPVEVMDQAHSAEKVRQWIEQCQEEQNLEKMRRWQDWQEQCHEKMNLRLEHPVFGGECPTGDPSTCPVCSEPSVYETYCPTCGRPWEDERTDTCTAQPSGPQDAPGAPADPATDFLPPEGAGWPQDNAGKE